jgi:hypothetical protein
MGESCICPYVMKNGLKLYEFWGFVFVCVLFIV